MIGLQVQQIGTIDSYWVCWIVLSFGCQHRTLTLSFLTADVMQPGLVRDSDLEGWNLTRIAAEKGRLYWYSESLSKSNMYLWYAYSYNHLWSESNMTYNMHTICLSKSNVHIHIIICSQSPTCTYDMHVHIIILSKSNSLII